MTKLNGLVEKGWGSETIFATNDLYCGKLLNFNQGAKFSMHMHKEKDETWHVLSGSFILKTIDTTTADVNVETLNKGDTKHIPPMLPHQLMCVEAGSIIEVSTPDSVEDNYRVEKGDSQNV
jgi:mannose-6-phosphate isomerase-like protein (cupin superfamily)